MDDIQQQLKSAVNSLVSQLKILQEQVHSLSLSLSLSLSFCNLFYQSINTL